MRIRSGFVSNSSSTSYVVINREGSIEKVPEYAFSQETGELLIPCEQGSHNFSGEEIWYNTTLDRINFAFCQLLYLCGETFPPEKDSDDYEEYEMFLEALGMEGYSPKFIMTEKEAKYEQQSIYGMSFDFYIDHSSSAVEGQNLEIFNNARDLHDFLFNFGSGIQGQENR